MNYNILMCFQVAGVTSLWGYNFPGLLGWDIGVIDDGLSGLYPDYWGYPHVGVRVLSVVGVIRLGVVTSGLLMTGYKVITPITHRQ